MRRERRRWRAGPTARRARRARPTTPHGNDPRAPTRSPATIPRFFSSSWAWGRPRPPPGRPACTLAGGLGSASLPRTPPEGQTRTAPRDDALPAAKSAIRRWRFLGRMCEYDARKAMLLGGTTGSWGGRDPPCAAPPRRRRPPAPPPQPTRCPWVRPARRAARRRGGRAAPGAATAPRPAPRQGLGPRQRRVDGPAPPDGWLPRGAPAGYSKTRSHSTSGLHGTSARDIPRKR